MKLIAISQRIDHWPDRDEHRDALDQRLIEWVISAGGLPVPVPNVLPDHTLSSWLAELHPAALILSGGNDIGEYPERDRTEHHLLCYAEACRAPLLGICRGMQMLAAHAGTELQPVTGHVRSRHLLSGDISGEVNSFHNCGLAACPAGFIVTARADDDTIEAIRHLDLPWEGWMWHPEREPEFSQNHRDRMKALFA